ncbi:MAG: cytochrome P450 [Pseudomonadota bacterium]
MSNAPFLDLADPGFSTRSSEVHAARRKSWYARTPYGIAILRHREAGLLLRDRRLRQGSHAWPRVTGLEGSFARFWTNSVIAQEGARHKHLRGLFQRAIRPEHIAEMTPAFEEIASDLIDGFGKRPEVEFMEAFATRFAGQAICTLLGLPRSDWRRVAEDASCLGLAMGIDAKRHEKAVNDATDRLFALAADLVDCAAEGQAGFVARLLAEGGDLQRDELLNLIVIAIFGGIDTTRAQLGLGMSLFAEHPEQWARLRRDPELIPAAIEETIRARPTTTWSTREALESFEFEGLQIGQGQTIHILSHATASDSRISETPGFDVEASRKMHFGFGGGAHHCLGASVARTDIAAALRVLTRRISAFSTAGAPAFLPETGNTSPVSLPLRLTYSDLGS